MLQSFLNCYGDKRGAGRLSWTSVSGTSLPRVTTVLRNTLRIVEG
jgi:hypothetical protein